MNRSPAIGSVALILTAIAITVLFGNQAIDEAVLDASRSITTPAVDIPALSPAGFAGLVILLAAIALCAIRQAQNERRGRIAPIRAGGITRSSLQPVAEPGGRH